MVAAETGLKSGATARTKMAANPNTLDMVVEAITVLNDRKGASIPAIKHFIMDKYTTVDPNMLKYRLKRALQKGLDQEVLARPKGMEDSGASLSGRFRLNKIKMAAIEKAKKPKPKPKAKAEKPKAKKPKPEESTKSPKKVKKAGAKTKETKKPMGAKKTKDVKTKKPKEKTAKSPGKKQKPEKKAKSKTVEKKTPKKNKKKPAQ